MRLQQVLKHKTRCQVNFSVANEIGKMNWQSMYTHTRQVCQFLEANYQVSFWVKNQLKTHRIFLKCYASFHMALRSARQVR